MTDPTPALPGADVLDQRINVTTTQLAGMRDKRRRLDQAIRQLEQHKIRLSALAVQGRTTPTAGIGHE